MNVDDVRDAEIRIAFKPKCANCNNWRCQKGHFFEEDAQKFAGSSRCCNLSMSGLGHKFSKGTQTIAFRDSGRS